jgi:hypothetical protein
MEIVELVDEQDCTVSGWGFGVDVIILIVRIIIFTGDEE